MLLESKLCDTLLGEKAKLQDTMSHCGPICMAYIWNSTKIPGKDDLGGDKCTREVGFS